MKITGSCSCNKASYEIDGTLNNPMSCHCSMCRKLFSSQAAACATFAPSSFEWTSDTEQVTYHQTSPDMGVYFCKTCGSHLVGTHKNEICWATLGCINEALALEPIKHIFMASKANWDESPEQSECFDEFPT